MKRALAIAVLTFAFASPAAAVPLVGEAAQTCMLGMFFTNPQKSAQAAQNYNTCPTIELTDQHGSYQAVRIEPGFAAAPIDRYAQCYYIDNYSQDAFFAPAKTPEEWGSFINGKPGLIKATRCCRPASFQNANTCGDTITIDYGRDGTEYGAPVGNAGREVTYECVAGEWTMTQSNQKPCDQTAANMDPNDNFARASTIGSRESGWAIQRNFTN
ncbi:MAG: hypothetical protein AB7G06_00280 [Bdellovibrionales bacterium]